MKTDFPLPNQPPVLQPLHAGQSFTALADGNQHIRIREKTLEFSPTVLSAL